MRQYTITIEIGGGQTAERQVWGTSPTNAKRRLILARATKANPETTKVVRVSQG